MLDVYIDLSLITRGFSVSRKRRETFCEEKHWKQARSHGGRSRSRQKVE